jgi:hypothetical protein
MELSDTNLIALILGPQRSPTRRGRAMRGMERVPEKRAARKTPWCLCGSCARCIDHAKWERIFAEKFEDPDYYKRPTGRRLSPFAAA